MLKIAAKVTVIVALIGASGLYLFHISRARSIPEVPLPASAYQVERTDQLFGRRQFTFELKEEYPGHSARDFFDSWATAQDWKKITEEEERWSGDRWQSFQDATVIPAQDVDQWLVHWASPDRGWSLRLALRYSRDTGSADDRSIQQVTLIVEPFSVLGRE